MLRFFSELFLKLNHHLWFFRKMPSSSEQPTLMKAFPSQNRQTKRKLSLVFELLCLLVLIVKHSFITIFRTIFPPKGKSLRDQVALVSMSYCTLSVCL